MAIVRQRRAVVGEQDVDVGADAKGHGTHCSAAAVGEADTASAAAIRRAPTR
jgi:hypothetical protein